MFSQYVPPLFMLVMLAGVFSSCVYFGIGLYERILLLKIPPTERPPWIPLVRFQNLLACLAMLGGLGYLLAYLIAKREDAGGSPGLILLASLFFFIQGIRRFCRAEIVKLS